MSEKAPKSKLELLRTCSFGEIAPDLSSLTIEERKAIFDRLTTDGDERWASEALEVDQTFSADEQEALVSMITDPELSFNVLTGDEARGKKLTQEQKETLMEQIKGDEEVAYVFYIHLIESGIEPNETETWWLQRLEAFLLETEDADIAAYALEHIASLTAEDRMRLERITRGE